MKYRGIELKQEYDEDGLSMFENEFCVGVELESYQDYRHVCKQLKALFKSNKSIIIEAVLDDYVFIRDFENFTFDNVGILNLKSIYDVAKQHVHCKEINIDIHVDEWFVGEDGGEYNNDCVSWEEFIEMLEV